MFFYEPGYIATIKLPLRRTLVLYNMNGLSTANTLNCKILVKLPSPPWWGSFTVVLCFGTCSRHYIHCAVLYSGKYN